MLCTSKLCKHNFLVCLDQWLECTSTVKCSTLFPQKEMISGRWKGEYEPSAKSWIKVQISFVVLRGILSTSSYLEYGCHLGQLRRRRRRCRRCCRAYTTKSNTASLDTTRKWTHGFPFLSYMSMGLLRAAGAPLQCSFARLPIWQNCTRTRTLAIANVVKSFCF